MKLSVLALDYDGTIARHGKPAREVLSAISLARARGIVVVLVTGRVLSDLAKDAGDVAIFDAVVAENGAVICFPGGRSRLLGRPPGDRFLEELRKAGIELEVGECVVSADAAAAPEILNAIRRLELPLALCFNRNRVMVLPQGISKATGLKEALNTLRLSPHNTLGIGDGENDFMLLDSSEVGVAVEWGSQALIEIADEVIRGGGPEAVGAYIRRVIESPRLPTNRIDRRRILLGYSADGTEMETAVHGQTILVAGDPRSGKSWITGLFLEQLILQGYCVCVFDPEGDYGPIEALPGVVGFGGGEPPPRVADLAKPLRYPDVSVLIDLSRLNHPEKIAYLREALPAVSRMRQATGQPHWIVVDEAHYFLDQPDYRDLIDVALGAYLLITHRVTNLHPDLLEEVEAIIVTQLTNPQESRKLTSLYGRSCAASEWEALLAGLHVDEAAILPPIGTESGAPLKFKVAERLTPHVRHRSKYLEVPMREWHGFTFTCGGSVIGKPALTLKEFAFMLNKVPEASLDEHARRGDFSRWIADVLGDSPMAEAFRQVEQSAGPGNPPDLRERLIAPIRERYGLAGMSVAAREMGR